MSILDLITGGIGPYLAAGGAVLAIVMAFFRGKASANAKRDARDAKAYQKTTERMQDAEAAFGDDPAVLRERLRERNPDQR
jgi:hypothetical protein